MRAAAAPLLALVVGVSGCASDNSASSRLPTCVEGDVTNGVILMAQSVPSATWVPCLRTNLPLGWSFVHLEARNGSSRFSLDSNRDGDKAIEVLFEKSCDTTGATEIPSDRAGLQRYGSGLEPIAAAVSSARSTTGIQESSTAYPEKASNRPRTSLSIIGSGHCPITPVSKHTRAVTIRRRSFATTRR